MPTVKAAFRGRIPLVNFDQGPAIPLCFVLQLAYKLTPAHITDAFSKTVVLEHVLDRKTLDTYDLVFAYDLSRELMLVVSSAVGNLLMNASDLQTSLIPILRALFLLGMPTLGFGQFLFVFGKELGIAVGVPIGGDDHRLQPQVKSYHLRRDFQGFDVLFYQDGDEIAVSLIFGNSDATGLTSIGQGPMPRDIQRSIHLGKGESLPIPDKCIASIGSRLLIPLLFELGILCAPFKEIAKGTIQVAKGLLECHRRNIVEPTRLFLLLEQHQALGCAFVVQTLTMLVVSIRTLAQGPIVDVTATAEGLGQDAFLFLAWIEAVLVGSFLFHALQYSAHAVKCQGGRFHPAPWNGAGLPAPSDKVQVWDATKGAGVRATYLGHIGSVEAVAWSPDGKRIVSGSYDRTAKVWDAVGGDSVATAPGVAPLVTYTGHSLAVSSVTWSPDGRRIASASYDSTVQVWHAV